MTSRVKHHNKILTSLVHIAHSNGPIRLIELYLKLCSIFSVSISNQPELLAGVELGPNLGMVKSSSLESLHNMVSHSIIKREGVGLRGVARAPPIASSLRRPIAPRSGVVPSEYVCLKSGTTSSNETPEHEYIYIQY